MSSRYKKGHKGYWSGKKRSEATKKKISEASKGKIGYWTGKKFSEEHRRKIGLAHKGMKRSKETKKNISLAKRGISLSKEHREKLSKSQKGHNVGSKSPSWKGGRTKAGKYIYIYNRKHPLANNRCYIMEQRLVVEKHLGRYLKRKEIVHHINEIVDDNRIENLMVFKNRIYHLWYHTNGYCNPKGIIFDGSKYKEAI